MNSPVVEAMARALFVSAYADHCDEEGSDPNLPRAMCGSDWMDVAPPTPQYALDAANQLLGRIEQLNGTNIWALLARAVKADGHVYQQNEEYVRLFGHYLAMQSLGHGVGWFDDHEKFELKLPHIEFMLEDTDELSRA